MATRQPTVSVCVPTYNRARYLKQALESVLSQTYQAFEVVVYDDASTDDTRDTVTLFRDSRLRYFRQPFNQGIARNRNSCLSVVRGRYIAWLDSDDLYHPEMLSRQTAVLDRYPNAGMVHGAFEVIDAEGRRLPDWPLPFAVDCVEPGRQAFRELVLSNYVNGATVLVRRECYDRLGTYSPRLALSGEDWEMWLRIALHSDLAYTATPLGQCRQHEGSSSNLSLANGRRLINDFVVIHSLWSRYAKLIPDSAVLREKAQAALALKALLRAGELFTVGRRTAALLASIRGLHTFQPLLARSHSWLLILSIPRNDEYRHFICTKTLLNHLYNYVGHSRFGEQIRKYAVGSPEWEESMRASAAVMIQVVPVGKRVAAVDKYDPSLLHYSQRTGWHFPDRRLLPGGYPRDSETAINHLEDLRVRGKGILYSLPPHSGGWNTMCNFVSIWTAITALPTRTPIV